MSIFDSSEIDLAHLIFAPDPLSRFQHQKIHGVRSGSANDQALRALMLALLEDAIACFQGRFFKPSRTNDKLFQEAEEWINSEDEGVFSFNNICETLGLHPGQLRKGLERWKAKQVGVPIEERKRLIVGKGKSGRKKKPIQDLSRQSATHKGHLESPTLVLLTGPKRGDSKGRWRESHGKEVRTV